MLLLSLPEMSSYPVRSVSIAAFIPAAPDDVFQLIADTRNDPEWCPNVEEAELIEGDGVEVGARFRFHQHLDRPGGGVVEFDATVEIVSLGEQSIEWKVEDRFQTREISIMVEPENDGTGITQTTHASFRKKPGLITRLGYPVLARRTFKDQFRHLAEHFGERRS